MLIENKRSLRLYLTPKAKSTREQKDKKRSTIKAEWAAFDSVLDCVIVTDEAGIVCYLNAAGEALTGWKASEIVVRFSFSFNIPLSITWINLCFRFLKRDKL